MLKPRNTLVVTTLIETATRQSGNITVPTNNDLYTHAIVEAIGPGTVAADGGRSETFDLQVGQKVWVKFKERRQGHPLVETGLRYECDGKTYHIFEQSSILGIVEVTPVMAN